MTELTSPTVAQRVRRFIAENFFVSDQSLLADDASLITGGVVDSTGLLEVIAFLESEYGISVLDQEMVPDNLETVGRISAFVERKRGGHGGVMTPHVSERGKVMPGVTVQRSSRPARVRRPVAVPGLAGVLESSEFNERWAMG